MTILENWNVIETEALETGSPAGIRSHEARQLFFLGAYMMYCEMSECVDTDDHPRLRALYQEMKEFREEVDRAATASQKLREGTVSL